MSRSATLEAVMPQYLAARRDAQRRDRRVLMITLLLATFCVVGAGFMLTPINTLRRERQLALDPETLKGLPPSLELASKLGPVRALVIDIAFIRYERLKEQGKNYEAYQLASLLSRLQPRFSGVWAYNAWNMAYNISVAYYSPEARWKWVTNGIRELRDGGIRYNPRDIALYKELGYIYWHKIADFLDDEHMSYKRALAVEMERVLGPPPIALSTREYIESFRPLADAPENLEAFLATDPEVGRLAQELSALGLTPDEVLLDFVARHLRPEQRFAGLTVEPGAEGDPELKAKRLALLNDPQRRPVVDRLLAAVRADVLRNDMSLDPKWMFNLMEKFGPLDWRAAWAHALYWSTLGDMRTEGKFNLNPNDQMNTIRFIFFALKYGVTRGRMLLIPNFDKPFESYIDFMPDTRYIPYLFDAYLEFGKKVFGDDPNFQEGTPGKNYRTGFFNWLEESVGNLYREGTEESLALAQKYYDHLRVHNTHPDGRTQERYMMPLKDFVFGQIKEELATYKQTEVIIRGFLDAGLDKIASGDRAGADGDFAAARECYTYYMSDKLNDINDRRRLQSFELTVAEQVVGYLTDTRRHPLMKMWLWDRIDLRLRQFAWDVVQPYLVELCARHEPPLDITRAFPEPPGMEEFRLEEVYQRFRENPTRELGEKK